MKTIIQLKRATPPLLVILAVACLGLSPKAQAVVPAPDGGYSGGNTAEGQNALLSLTFGIYNTGVGIYSLLSVTDGRFNTGVGAGTLLANTADENTATGAGALLSNTTGDSNTASGTFALFSNTTGGANSAMGASALLSNTQGDNNTAVGAAALLNSTATGNTAIGSNALLNNTTGGTLGNIQGFDVGPNVAVGWQALESNTVASANTAVGYQALHSFTTGPMGFEQIGFCTAVGFQALANNAADGFGNSGFGYQALMSNTDGTGNTAVGFSALSNNTASGNTAIGGFALVLNTIGGNNTANGTSALFSNDTGARNTANGNSALLSNTTGDDNTANGNSALLSNTTGASNTAVGRSALVNSTGSGNTAFGFEAGANQTTGSENVYIGAGVNGVAGENNTIHIAENLPDAQGASACSIGGIFNQTSASGIPVLINGSHKLGTTTSSKRFKEDIKSMDNASQALFSLKPVSFRYRKEIDPAGIPQLGLVAEDVEKVNPDLVVRDKEGKPYTVRYDQVNAMLLNEFLKEHRKVEAQNQKLQEQETTITQLKKEMKALVAHAKEQDSKIQRVSGQIEMTKEAPRMVATDR